jgi:hypothetical protein
MTNPPRERRRAARARADFPIQLQPGEGAAPARLRDVSSNGLCCTTSAPLPEMSLVGIDLQLPGDTRRHSLQGAVVRCERLPAKEGTGDYEVAVFFTQIEPATASALGAFVARAGGR